MKLTVKTLKGEKFPIEVELETTVAAVKGIIQTTKTDLSGSNMKLIHSGKVLKDEETLDKYGIKPNDFLVVMVTKAKKVAAAPQPPPPVAASAPTAEAAPASTATTSATPSTTATPNTSASTTTEAMETTSTTTTTPATPAPSSTAASAPPAAPARSEGDEFPAEVVANLVVLGFPEAEVRHCLRAAQGNPDVAVEFLTNGIPPGLPMMGSSSAPTPNRAAAPSSGGGSLQALRQHPQFDALRQLVQTNPQMLQQVLTIIGQRQPELLQEINANQALFLEMMNEPIESSPSSNASAPSAPAPSGAGAGAGAAPPGIGFPPDPAQMAQMMENMDPEQLQQMASVMGMTPVQFQALGRMIGQLPPEQLQEYMAHSLQEGGLPGAGGAGGGGGPTVLYLTEEELAAVDRLTDMGFDRARAAEAFLACDKDEALAANFLMDSVDDAFGGGGDMGGGGGGDGGNNNNDGGGGGGNDDNVDDMYD